MDMPRNSFKHAIARGETQIGLWCSLCSPITTEIVSHSGFDWLLLDTEHSPNEVPDVLRATEYVVPAIEIVDARIQDPRKIFDTVADNGAAAGIVIGGRPVGPLEVDLRWVGGIMYKNSEIEETGVAAGVLGHPALGVAWLANKLGSHGVTLEPGHLILAGSFTRVVFAGKGDTLHAEFGPLGGIAVQFV